MQRFIDWIHQKHEFRRFLKFCISGISSSLAEIIIFAVMASVLLLNTWLSNAVSIGVSMVIGYLMNRHFTFRHRHPHPSSFIMYFLLNVWNIIFSSWLIDLLATVEPWHKTPLKILTLLICATWNYFLYKHVIFRHFQKA